MNDTPAPQPAKAPSKPTKPAAATKVTVAAPTIKSSPINPAWATEVAKAYGLTGPVADAIAEHLAKTLGEALDKVTRPAKLAKLVKEAFNKCIG